MNRRSFLFTTSSVLLAQGVAGCSSQKQQALSLQVLQSSLSPQVIKSFQRNHPSDLKISLASAPDELYELLQHWGTPETKASGWQPWTNLGWHLPWGKPPEPTHLVSLGDSWLSAAIAQNLLRPIDVAQLPNWRSLPDAWKNLVQRDLRGQLSAQGQAWGAPYRWGCTAIAYNREKFKRLGWEPTDWTDLWKPELQGRISLLDQPREVIGLTLKTLGQSYNVRSLTPIPELLQKLTELNRQTRLYSSDTYLQPLILGDTWLAVGWSSDIVLAMQQNPEIGLVVPNLGTALWADLWVQPRSADVSTLSHPWMDFCLQPEVMQQIAHLSRGGTWLDKTPLDPLSGDSSIWVEPSVLGQSEFLQPLSKQAAQEYLDLWKQMRHSMMG